MKPLFQSDITKTLLYFILTLLAAAALAPWLYNLGKMISEVSESRNTSATTQIIAGWCKQAEFGHFFLISFVGCALTHAGPFVCWLRLGANNTSSPMRPWTIRLPNTGTPDTGQPLAPDSRRIFNWATGFLLAGSLLALMNWLFLLTGWFKFNHPVQLLPSITQALLAAAIVSVIFEWLFRGVLLGILLRALRPGIAITTISLLYACLVFLLPYNNWNLAQPGDADAGFRYLESIFLALFTFSGNSLGFFTMLFSGLILAYTRFRTASLSLSIGLQTGWLFMFFLSLEIISIPTPANPRMEIIIGIDRLSGFMPLCILIATGLLAHVFVELSKRNNAAA